MWQFNVVARRVLSPTKQPPRYEEIASPQRTRLATTCKGLFIMPVGKRYCVYIMTNTHNTVLYTGVTNNLARRVYEHRNGLGGIFTKKYNVCKLVYYEVGEDVNAVIAREKQIKGGSRKKKVDLINSANPAWKDLYEEII